MAETIGELWGKIARIFDKNGSLAKVLPTFELRPGQKQMAESVFRAFVEECISVVEAGTGTGKTMAYLIPAFFVSQVYKEPVIVATRTINLQEQILYKDVPLVTEAVGDQMKAVLVKGWSNYLCLRRMKNLEQSQELFDHKEFMAFKKLKDWERRITTGDKSDLDFTVPDSLWEQVCADSSTCTMRRCPWFNQCFYFAQKRNLKDANILVTNHALLFTHLANKRNSPTGASSVLPDFSRLIIDEAHHLEEVASNFLGEDASSMEFYKILDTLYTVHRRREDKGLLVRVRENMFSPMLQKKIQSMLDSYVIPRVTGLRETGAEFFFRIAHLPFLEAEEDRIRLTPDFKEKAAEVGREFETFSKTVTEYMRQLATLRDEVQRENEDLAAELTGVIGRIEAFLTGMAKVWEADNESWIYSLEYSRRGTMDYVRLKSYPLNVADILHGELFKDLKTTVLTSATLSINRNFKYLSQRLGLDRFEKDFVQSKIIDSPFDFKKQAVVAIPNDIPLADNDNFMSLTAPHLAQLIKVMEGRTFLLFTSYRMLEKCAAMLREHLDGGEYNILVQGESPRHTLLKKFKDLDKAVLLGTDSFWEGVDVPGRDLECVVIMKLPFKVPTDPVIKARTDYMVRQGQDPFLQYHVPQAVIKFKQGFGRLIRNTKDRGIIVVLDCRIIERTYGKAFLTSLPEVRMVKGSFAGVVKYVEKWQRESRGSRVFD